MPRRTVKTTATLVVVAAVLVGGYYGVQAFLSTDPDIPLAPVKKGEFVLSVRVSGQVDASQAFSLVAPRVRNLQLTWLAPEGSIVKPGDPVIRFNATQQQAELQDNQSGLKIAETTLERAKKELAIQEKQLALELQQAQRNYDEMKYEAPRVAEEAKLKLELAQLNNQAKLEQQRADVEKATFEVQRARDKVMLAQRELDQMTLTAPIDGMVVHLDIWKGSAMSKVQAGDSPWPGQAIINLPDLSDMLVKATLSEVDASAVEVDQEAIVAVDAFADTTYKAKVTRKGALARRKDPNSKINVFDVDLAILDEDPALKPGMSASAQIIVQRLPDVVSVPLEAVFEKEGKPVVYLEDRTRRDVQVGRRNDRDIEIVAGLQGGERICLVDPTLEGPELPGDKATEPEMNKGRTRRSMAPPAAAPPPGR